jgi:tRNA dimethylallyltransferase
VKSWTGCLNACHSLSRNCLAAISPLRLFAAVKPKLAIVLGPTAVGKSDTVLDLALHFDAEIISADSQQVYRYMDIGTAKPSKEQRQAVPHHLIDIVDPNEEFNAAMFRNLATEIAYKLADRDKRVIVCGGTGLYIKALAQGLFAGPGGDPQIRQALEWELEEHGIPWLYRRLEQVDPQSAARIHPNDRQRITRALEVCYATGRKISEWQSEHRFNDLLFDVLKIGLNRPRSDLYDRIDRRCEFMIRAGLLDEVEKLVDMGYGLDLKPMQSIGYRHLGLFLRARISLDNAVDLMKRDTRRFAKRQLTWFRGDREIRWFDPETQRGNIEDTVREFYA